MASTPSFIAGDKNLRNSNADFNQSSLNSKFGFLTLHSIQPRSFYRLGATYQKIKKYFLAFDFLFTRTLYFCTILRSHVEPTDKPAIAIARLRPLIIVIIPILLYVHFCVRFGSRRCQAPTKDQALDIKYGKTEHR